MPAASVQSPQAAFLSRSHFQVPADGYYCVSQPEEQYRTGHEQMRYADLPEGCDWVEQNWVGPDGPTRVGGPNEQNIGQRDQMETS